MTRRLIKALLLVMLALPGSARALAAPRGDDDTKITPEEEREARELVEQFNKKFVETNDIGPLVKEYFVPDFAPRLNRHAETFPFQLIDWKEGAAPPDDGDLLRFYVASTNCLQLLLPIMYDSYKKAERERGEGSDPKEPTFGEMLPPEAVELIKTDPLLRAAWEEAEKPDDATETSPPEADADAGDKSAAADEAQKKKYEELRIDDGEKLRRLTAVVEGVSKILRRHPAAHPVAFEKVEKHEDGESEGSDGEPSFDPERVKVSEDARVLRYEFYGYPEGTRLVCADAGALHVEMVRVDGRLRILTVFLLMDD